MTHPNQTWTEAEDAILREAIEGGKTFEEAGAMLGRSKNACVGRGNRLRIVAPKLPKRLRKPRTDAYWQSLKDQGRENLAQFAEALANAGTVKGAASEIGISHQRGSQLFRRICEQLGWQAC